MRLTGECSRCGLCCAARVGATEYRCEHLAADNTCAVYDKRFDGMPVMLVSGEKTIAARCGKDSEAEAESILRFIGSGCSLMVE